MMELPRGLPAKVAVCEETRLTGRMYRMVHNIHPRIGTGLSQEEER